MDGGRAAIILVTEGHESSRSDNVSTVHALTLVLKNYQAFFLNPPLPFPQAFFPAGLLLFKPAN
jgi:hypothetical protein